MTTATRTGILCAIAANTLWGLFPIFWSWLRRVPSDELVSHRILWAFVFSAAIAAIRFRVGSNERRSALKGALSRRRTWKLYSASGVLIAINWLAFLWAVTHDRVLLASLGYYINPLFNVLLGVIVFGERLSPQRWVAVGFAAMGVLVLTLATGEVPWVSLAMASSFAGYALIKKKSDLDPLDGLMIETSVLMIPTLLYLTLVYAGGGGVFGRDEAWVDWLLVLGGLVTLVPLALFSAATQRAPLSLIGVLQYVGPTLQFLVGLFYFGESISAVTLAGFSLVWAGVGLFLSTRR